ncbi:MAG TPA: methyltransferase type 11, partial [Solirubrobacteraceae bacterium]|nr:methyltransferase type 11 [Solirubrobacteraceae bacterium]
PQQAWALDVLARLEAISEDATVLDVGGGTGRITEVIEAAARKVAPQLVGWSPWEFAGPEETKQRLSEAGFVEVRCWLQERPTHPQDVAAFVRTSILAAHLDRLPEDQREAFASMVTAAVRPPLDYVRLNVSAVRGPG